MKQGDIILQMKIKYFSDTDTALLEFSDAEVAETREIIKRPLTES